MKFCHAGKYNNDPQSLPHLQFLGVFGALAISMGAGDYMNVFNAIRQVPKDARIYSSGIHSYWYYPQS